MCYEIACCEISSFQNQEIMLSLKFSTILGTLSRGGSRPVPGEHAPGPPWKLVPLALADLENGQIFCWIRPCFFISFYIPVREQVKMLLVREG